MEAIGIIGILAAVISIIAGIVQVIQYFQERKKTKQQTLKQILKLNDNDDTDVEIQNLPVKQNIPNPGKFIGREKEIEKILGILRPYPYSQEHLITIDGVGGIGKSALAIEIANRLLRQYRDMSSLERFDAIIWTSAKKDLLTADGVIPRLQIIRTLEQIYIVIAFILDKPEIMQLKPDEQTNAIQNLLSQQRTLLIIDNLETIDDEEIIAFLRELPAPTKCIVTSRHRIDVAFPVRLTGMDEGEAIELMKNECQRLDVFLVPESIKRLYDRTGGVPLAMVLSIAQIAKGFGLETILDRLGKPSSDIARFCFDYSLEKLSKNEWKLLMSLSMFSAGTTREFLGEISELAEIDRDTGLAELEKLSLINRSSNRFWMLPLSLEYVHEKISVEEPEIAKLKHNFAKTYLRIKIDSTDSTEDKIQAVHLAIDLSDLIVWDTVIAEYLSANLRAINRGVEIIRIFVLEEELTFLSESNRKFHPEIIRILNAQSQMGIDVRVLWKSMVDAKQLPEPADLIIFDSREIHIHKGHGGWYYDVDILVEPEEIKLWKKRFLEWVDSSQQWVGIRE